MTALIEIEVSREVSGPPAAAFARWLDPTKPGGPWFGAKTVKLDPVEGGLFYHVVEHAGRQWAHYGRFIRITAPRYLEFTWVSESTKGVESLITVEFDAEGHDTKVTLRHANVPDDELGRQHKEGWTWALDMLAGALASSGA